MNDPNRKLLVDAARVLQPLLGDLVFVGGCATGLLISDPAAADVRPTKDVDAIAEIASYAEYAQLSDRLRAVGLSEDSSEGAPACRWRKGDLIIDVMPTEERILGFASRWYGPAIGAARLMRVGGLEIRVITPEHFLATKLEAFHGRGRNDYTGSHDLEDVIAVVDGRSEIVGEVLANPDVREYVSSEIGRLLGIQAFLDALPGFLLPDRASQERQPLLVARLRAIAGALPASTPRPRGRGPRTP